MTEGESRMTVRHRHDGGEKAPSLPLMREVAQLVCDEGREKSPSTIEKARQNKKLIKKVYFFQKRYCNLTQDGVL